ncbi:4Fe-4S dicluster domain-containing protein [Treponema zioleckii]|uniref:4Fe-4S dicluster domain-containing protein n=1 Tax=Treponema zioleckii TaxID=331680 RepID=UPI00168AD89C|nr:ferredoxin family protein [Treponema zioleckii]
MSIKIDENRCVGCRACVEVCPGNLIKISEKNKSFIKHERDCWGCTSCVKACPKQAISFFLGADIGGRGASLTVESHGTIRTWKISINDGSVQEIQVDSSDANKY